MDHSDLVDIAGKWLKKTKRCGVVFTELVTWVSETPDAIGWTAQKSILVECKATHADFLADKKKSFRRNPEMGMGVERYFMVPEGLIGKDELPPKWGLVYVSGGQARQVLKSEFFSDFNMTAERKMMYSALRRLAIRGHMKEIYARDRSANILRDIWGRPKLPKNRNRGQMKLF